jgi:hypothetical protein
MHFAVWGIGEIQTSHTWDSNKWYGSGTSSSRELGAAASVHGRQTGRGTRIATADHQPAPRRQHHAQPRRRSAFFRKCRAVGGQCCSKALRPPTTGTRESGHSGRFSQTVFADLGGPIGKNGTAMATFEYDKWGTVDTLCDFTCRPARGVVVAECTLALFHPHRRRQSSVVHCL